MFVSILLKKIKCANDRVSAITDISSTVDGDPHIDADYQPTNVPATAIPIENIVNTALNIEDDEDKHKHRWELPGNYPIFTVVMVIYHYVERIWRIIVTTILIYNIYDHS